MSYSYTDLIYANSTYYTKIPYFSIIVWDKDESLKIKVNCRADARDFATAIPYALLVSFEIAPELDIDVYQKITDKVHINDTVKPKDIIKSKTI